VRRVGDECCTAEVTVRVLSGEWKVLIVWHLLQQRELRFSALRRRLGGVSEKMLTQQLRSLESHGVVSRKVHPVVPPRVEYSLTPLGRSLEPVVDAMCAWGERHRGAGRGGRS